MVIGLTGYKGSGKDTVGQYLVEQYGFERRAFGDKLKEAACALLDILPFQIEKFKNDEMKKIGVVYDSGFNMGGLHYEGRLLTFREFLQRFGTEMGREVFGPDFWVERCLYNIGSDDNIVVTDCRFDNELDYIKDVEGGKIIRVERPGCGPDGHSSENPPDWYDIKIYNIGTIEDLKQEIDSKLVLLNV